MKLTDTQERRIAEYLRDTQRRIAHWPDNDRRRAIAHVKAQLREKLEPYADAAPADDEFEDILRNCRMPGGARRTAAPADDPIERIAARHAPEPEPKQEPEPPRPPTVHLGWSSRIWLGVCAGLADKLQVEPFVVRVAVAILGVATGGMLLWVYLAAFFVLRQQEPEGALPGVQWWSFAWTPLAVFAVSLLLYVFAETVLWGMGYVTALAVGHETSVESGWRWLEYRNRALIFWTLVNALPLAAMSALPVAGGWESTLRKLAQACVALYALLICIGLAASFAGHVLAAVEELTGVTPGEAQPPPIF